MLLEDAREYVFPLFSVVADAEANGVYMKTRRYLGTAFFVTKQGHAVASGHTISALEDLPKDRRPVAVVVGGGREQVCWVNYAATVDAFDFALVKVNLDTTRYLEINPEPVSNGKDVQILGIPDHEVNASGKEMRVLKGHVTLSGARLELSIPILAGMSGAPVFVGTRVVAYATGVARSEQLEELVEEETVQRSSGEKIIKRTEIKRFVHYGIARPFSALGDLRHAVLSNKTLFEFIDERNRGS